MHNISKISSGRYDGDSYLLQQVISNNNELVEIIDDLQGRVVSMKKHENALEGFIEDLLSIDKSKRETNEEAIKVLNEKIRQLENDIKMLCENQGCLKKEIPNIKLSDKDYQAFLEKLREQFGDKFTFRKDI